MRAEGLRLPAMDLSTLRAWWWQKQGLDGSLKGADPAAVLERCGWARSVGGVGPYLMFFSRAGVGRERADKAVAGLEIHELPSARGCTYVVPASDFALALQVGRDFAAAPMKQAVKLASRRRRSTGSARPSSRRSRRDPSNRTKSARQREARRAAWVPRG